MGGTHAGYNNDNIIFSKSYDNKILCLSFRAVWCNTQFYNLCILSIT